MKHNYGIHVNYVFYKENGHLTEKDVAGALIELAEAKGCVIGGGVVECGPDCAICEGVLV